MESERGLFGADSWVVVGGAHIGCAHAHSGHRAGLHVQKQGRVLVDAHRAKHLTKAFRGTTDSQVRDNSGQESQHSPHAISSNCVVELALK